MTALEERRREALPDLPPSDLINVALQKYRWAPAPYVPASKDCLPLPTSFRCPLEVAAYCALHSEAEEYDAQSGL